MSWVVTPTQNKKKKKNRRIVKYAINNESYSFNRILPNWFKAVFHPKTCLNGGCKKNKTLTHTKTLTTLFYNINKKWNLYNEKKKYTNTPKKYKKKSHKRVRSGKI